MRKRVREQLADLAAGLVQLPGTNAKAFESRGSDETIRILERRIDLQEQEMAGLRATVQGVEDAHDFERKLSAPPALPPSTEG